MLLSHEEVISRTVLKNHPNVTIGIDYVCVEDLAKFFSISVPYQLCTIETMKELTRVKANKKDKLEHIGNTLRIYQSLGLQVTQIDTDNKFQCVKDSFHPIRINIVGSGEHVHPAERLIRSVKEHITAHVIRNPYQRYPRIMRHGVAVKSIMELNSVPASTGISGDISPLSIIYDQPSPDFAKLMKFNFGNHAIVHKGGMVDKDLEARGMGAIALYPGKNKTWYFVSLRTSRLIHRHWWEKTVITDDVINRVNLIGKSRALG
mmetsp:Transcript_3286/g.4607  ORF Transcript_3286/g.4607 Transcript_3286/m.4607 type:complete len:262 (-) Transcript_3286:534-1319(-)